MRILILCTGNSCRSQMAHGILASMNPDITVCSAGTKPAKAVNQEAVKVLNEIGIDISSHVPTSVSDYISQSWDFVITVCGNAKETCPYFVGDVKYRKHIGFSDPSEMVGTPEEVHAAFVKVRTEIEKAFTEFYHNEVKPLLETNGRLIPI